VLSTFFTPKSASNPAIKQTPPPPTKNRPHKIGALIKERRGGRITYQVQISPKNFAPNSTLLANAGIFFFFFFFTATRDNNLAHTETHQTPKTNPR
jgi:hypothetical protein